MKIKKMFCICVCLITILVQLLPYDIKASDDKALYYKTFEYDLADEYVMNTIGELINSEAKVSMINVNDIKIGSGIYIHELNEDNNLPMFYYPMYLNNELKYVFRVYDDGVGNYTGAFSQNYVKEILEYSSYTQDDAVTWIITNGNELALKNTEYEIINKSKYNEEIDQDAIIKYLNNKSTNLKSVDITQRKLEFKIHPQARAYWVTPITYPETQSGEKWCLGYVTTSAIRLISGNNNVMTRNMATLYGLSNNQGFTWAQVSNFSSRYGVSFSGPYNGTISAGSIYLEVANRDLVLGAYKNGSSYHALLLHGVNGNNIRVWNPWYAYSEWIISPFIYKANGLSWAMYAYGMYR